jgi:hypothetical protein
VAGWFHFNLRGEGVSMKAPEIKVERRQLLARNANQTLMYPGTWVFTWLRIGAIWHLLAMEQEAEA